MEQDMIFRYSYNVHTCTLNIYILVLVIYVGLLSPFSSLTAAPIIHNQWTIYTTQSTPLSTIVHKTINSTPITQHNQSDTIDKHRKLLHQRSTINTTPSSQQHHQHSRFNANTIKANWLTPPTQPWQQSIPIMDYWLRSRMFSSLSPVAL